MTRKYMIWLLIAVTAADRIITLHYWHLESNPIVTILTPFEWTAGTIILLGTLTVLWYQQEAWHDNRVYAAVSLLTVFTVVLWWGNVVTVVT